MSTLTAVAMSGGVDSSVAATLLAKRGAPLVGFSMQLVPDVKGGRCCSLEDFKDAAAVASRLGFPHHVLDMQEVFKAKILDPFAQDYAQGRTPSPCVRCNTYLKFDALLDRARAVGASKVATGHYAIFEYSPRTGRTLLRAAADPDKDQSYFLFDLSDEQRASAELPLGRLTKPEVRDIARAAGLLTAEKPESMDLCFASKGESYHEVLARGGLTSDAAAGEIVAKNGDKLGTHEGISRFTIGQRRGLGIASSSPLYVVELDATNHRVVVGDEKDLYRESCTVERVRWIPFDRPSGPVTATIRIRSNHAGAQASIVDHGDGTASIRFDTPQRAVAPGQAAVFYDDDLVLGGGWIAAAA
ncbi:MAG TPA: tRNA 2-thiouridine(34) synthase MnmA [Candidatus Polarisedimenticolaceae bacterium]|nr:tRNA 2-thiouridine(34) synthase MnmA [Candidatus Polarisedimenticolaceae bacterium]